MSASFRLFVDGTTEVCYTHGSLRVTRQLGERGTGSVSLTVTGPRPFDTGDIVTVTRPDGTTVIWRGVVDRVNQRVNLDQTKSSTYNLTLVSIEAWASRRRYSEAFTNVTLEDLVTDIVASELSDIGVTVGTVADVGTIPSFRAQLEAVDEILRRICDKYGLVWQINPATLELDITERGVVAAPFDIVEDVPGAKWSEMSIDEETGGYFNRIHVAGWSVTDPRTEEFAGDGERRTFNMSLPVALKPEIEVNGSPQTVGIQGLDTGRQWYWNKGQTEITQDEGETPLGQVTVETTGDELAYTQVPVGRYEANIKSNGNWVYVSTQDRHMVTVQQVATGLEVELFRAETTGFELRDRKKLDWNFNGEFEESVFINSQPLILDEYILINYFKWTGSAYDPFMQVFKITTEGLLYVKEIDMDSLSGYTGHLQSVSPESRMSNGYFAYRASASRTGFSWSGNIYYIFCQFNKSTETIAIRHVYDTSETSAGWITCSNDNVAMKVGNFQTGPGKVVLGTYDFESDTLGSTVNVTSVSGIPSDALAWPGGCWSGDYFVLTVDENWSKVVYGEYVDYPVSLIYYDKSAPSATLKHQIHKNDLGFNGTSYAVTSRGTSIYVGRGTSYDGSTSYTYGFVSMRITADEELEIVGRVPVTPKTAPPDEYVGYGAFHVGDIVVWLEAEDLLNNDVDMQAFREGYRTVVEIVSSDTLSVTYRGMFRDLETLDDPAQIAQRAAQSGGAGVYESAATLGQDRAGELTDHAQGQLERYAQFMRRVRYRTRTDGLEPGQIQQISLPSHNVEGSFLIERISHVHQAGHVAYTEVDGIIGGDLASWQTYFRQLTGAGKGVDLGAGEEVIIPTGPDTELVLLSEQIQADESDPDPVIGQFIIGLDEIQGEE